jgi:hypothetical protein
VMAYEILLGVAGLCVAGVIALAAVEVPRWRKATPGYQPKHTGEQRRVTTPAAHVGATEQWSPAADIGPAQPLDARDRLQIAEAQIEHWQRVAERERAAVAEAEALWVHRALDRMERGFRDRLARAGQRETPTVEWRRSDIRRIVRSGAPR